MTEHEKSRLPQPLFKHILPVAHSLNRLPHIIICPGETANGKFPDTAVSTMAAIVSTAEIGVDYYSQFSFIRHWATKYRCVLECLSCCI